MNGLLIIKTLPFLFFYYKLNNKLENIQTKKLALNSISLLHASSSVLLGLNYLLRSGSPSLIQMNTGGYLLFDIYYMIKAGKLDLLRFMYLYHHMAVFPYLLLSPTKYYWPQVIFYAELSNIPNYIVYYSLKQDETKNLYKGYKSTRTKSLLKIQMYFYAFFRIFVLGYYGFLEFNNPDKPIAVYLTSVLYIFCLIWFGAMVKQNRHSLKL